jgi:hypothetical protein
MDAKDGFGMGVPVVHRSKKIVAKVFNYGARLSPPGYTGCDSKTEFVKMPELK